MYLNDLLTEKIMTKYRLAKESGIPQTTITDICSRKARIEKCSADTIYKIAKVLDVSMESLIEQEMEDYVQEPRRCSFEVFKSNVCHFVKDKGDIDAIIRASSAMKEAINKVGDELGLSNGWLNSDFIDFEKKYPGVTNVDNVNDIIKGLKKRKENKQLILSNLPWEEILPGSFFLTSNPNKNIIKIS